MCKRCHVHTSLIYCVHLFIHLCLQERKGFQAVDAANYTDVLHEAADINISSTTAASVRIRQQATPQAKVLENPGRAC